VVSGGAASKSGGQGEKAHHRCRAGKAGGAAAPSCQCTHLEVYSARKLRVKRSGSRLRAAQMKWKLRRGKWRPRLQALVDELPSDAVVEASTAAFAALAEESAEAEAALRAAVNALTVLKVTPPICRIAAALALCRCLPGTGLVHRPALGDLNVTDFPVRVCSALCDPAHPRKGAQTTRLRACRASGPPQRRRCCLRATPRRPSCRTRRWPCLATGAQPPT
jgi:hypothetical protein